MLLVVKTFLWQSGLAKNDAYLAELRSNTLEFYNQPYHQLISDSVPPVSIDIKSPASAVVCLVNALHFGVDGDRLSVGEGEGPSG